MFAASPVVRKEIRDFTGQIPGAGITTGAAVIKAAKGAVNKPVLCVSVDDLYQNFGTPDPAISDALECLTPFLRVAPCYVMRVDNGSKYSHSSIYNLQDFNEGESIADTYDSFFPAGTLTHNVADTMMAGGFEDGQISVQILEIQGAVITSNALEVEYSMGGGAAAVTVTTNYATSSAATLAAFAAAIQTSLRSNVDNRITVSLVTEATTQGSNYIRIVAPQGVDLPIFSEFTLTGGDTQVDVIYWPEAKLLDVFALTPGVHGDDVGYRIRDVKYSNPASAKIALSGFMATGHTFSATLNGVSLSAPVSYATSHKATMDAIILALRNKFGPLGYFFRFGSQTWDNALGTNPSSAAVTDLEIHVRYMHFGSDLVASVAMGGSTPPTATVTYPTQESAYISSFTFEVFIRSDSSAPVESFNVTLQERIDGNGRQTNIESVINDSELASKYIRVKQAPYTKYAKNGIVRLGGSWRDSAKTTFDVHTSIQWLANGTDGGAISDALIASAWDTFLDTTRYNVKLLINCGYASDTVHRKMLEVAKTRRDSFALLDVPQTAQKTAALREYRQFTLAADNSYGTIISPYIKITSKYSPNGRFIPPSGDIAAQIAFNDRNKMWEDPSGLNRGVMDRAVDVQEDYTKADLDLLCPLGISPIIRHRGGQIVFWDAKTLQVQESALSILPIRRTLSEIETAIGVYLENFLKRPANANTRFNITQRINMYLEPIKQGEGLSFYLVKCDGDNNKEADEAVGRINLDILLIFVQPTREIVLRTNVADGQITIQEIIRQLAA